FLGPKKAEKRKLNALSLVAEY
ncbi:MAG: hypothetical protein RLZZ328_1016, partial [Bacteroidota bacterium]